MMSVRATTCLGQYSSTHDICMLSCIVCDCGAIGNLHRSACCGLEAPPSCLAQCLCPPAQCACTTSQHSLHRHSGLLTPSLLSCNSASTSRCHRKIDVPAPSNATIAAIILFICFAVSQFLPPLCPPAQCMHSHVRHTISCLLAFLQEYLAGWGKSVVVGRARLGGIPMGVINVETRLSEQRIPADPANSESREVLQQQAGQVRACGSYASASMPHQTMPHK